MAEAQYPNHIRPGIVPVKREIPGGAVGDHKFPPMLVDAAPYLRMLCEHRYRRTDLLQRLGGRVGRSRKEEFDDPVEVVERLVRID